MEKLMFWALVAIVAVAPLPLGSNRPLAWSFMSAMVGVLLVVWAINLLTTEAKPRFPPKKLTVPFVLFCLSLSWALIQLVPGIPFGLAHPSWQSMGTFLGVEPAGRITIDPEATLTVLMRWITYAAVFWLTVQLCAERIRAQMAVNSVVVASALYALYGLVAQLSGTNTILFFEKWASIDAVTSTFVNRNSYATFAGFGLVAVIGKIISRGSRRGQDETHMRRFLTPQFSYSLAQNLFLYLAFFLILSALVLTGSRAGALSALGGAVVLLLCFARGRKQTWRRVSVRTGTLAGVAVFILLVSGALLGERFGVGLDESRQSVYEQTLVAIEDHALVGSGLGSFPQIFPLYRGSDEHWNKYWDKAHNSYLENALELGLPFALCLYLTLLALAAICWKGLLTRARDHHFTAIGLGVCTTAALHSLGDFSLQVPAVTVVFMFLMGVGVAQSVSSRRH